MNPDDVTFAVVLGSLVSIIFFIVLLVKIFGIYKGLKVLTHYESLKILHPEKVVKCRNCGTIYDPERKTCPICNRYNKPENSFYYK